MHVGKDVGLKSRPQAKMTIGVCDGCRTRGVLLNSWRPRSRELGSRPGVVRDPPLSTELQKSCNARDELPGLYGLGQMHVKAGEE